MILQRARVGLGWRKKADHTGFFYCKYEYSDGHYALLPLNKGITSKRVKTVCTVLITACAQNPFGHVESGNAGVGSAVGPISVRVHPELLPSVVLAPIVGEHKEDRLVDCLTIF